MEQQSKFDCLIQGDSTHETGSFDPWIYLWGLAIQKPDLRSSGCLGSLLAAIFGKRRKIYLTRVRTGDAVKRPLAQFPVDLAFSGLGLHINMIKGII